MLLTPIASNVLNSVKTALAAGSDEFAPIPNFALRDVWSSLQKGPHAGPAARLISAADGALLETVPALPLSLFLAYSRTGQRLPYETPQIRRRQMMGQLAIAFCLTGAQKYLLKLEDVVWATVEESTWAWPAHCPDGVCERDAPVLDLSAAMTGFELAEVAYLIGDNFAPILVRRIQYEIEQRCVAPFLDRDHHWMHSREGDRVNNWAAVCLCGVVGAALYIEDDQERLAKIIARALPVLDAYVESFDADGGSSEGPGYWSYGFSYFTALAHMLELRTNGEIDLFADPAVALIAAFPLKTILSPGLWLNFSDADQKLDFIAGHLDFLAERVGVSELSNIPAPKLPTDQHARRISWMLRDLVWQKPREQGALVPEHHDWFGEMGWMISRVSPKDPGGLVVAAKSGHNGEMHNQNDVGSFVVHWKEQSLIAELGRGRYVKGYFGGERYNYLPNRSLGHSVPLINGVEQGTGTEFCAKVLEHSSKENEDVLVLDMVAAYPAEAGLESLTRNISVSRKGDVGAVDLHDEYCFAGDEFSFVSALVCLGKPEVFDGFVVIPGWPGGLKIMFDAGSNRASFAVEPKVAFPLHDADVYRVLFTPLTPERSGSLELRILPQ